MNIEDGPVSERTDGPQDGRVSLQLGMDVAESLWQNYQAMGAEFKGKRILDFGCAWGYMCKLGLDKGADVCVGVDILPHWEKLGNLAALEQDGLHLICGDLLDIDELQPMCFDMILSSGTLFLLDSTYLDKVLAWFCDHLVPGGEAFLRTRCVTAKSFNDLGSRLVLPGAQLLFSRRAVNQVLAEKGYQSFKSHLGYTSATWIMACHGAGFDVVNMRRHGNTEVESTAAQHHAKLRWLSPLEISTGEITLHLRKPIERQDMTSFRRLD
ncbi:MAG TPA: class I SAM-dependent methyltransferase [Thiobacillaceae bacterium]|nr:class I SAM-dependent methyltransferase [Thiobacillaceae bacterium]